MSKHQLYSRLVSWLPSRVSFAQSSGNDYQSLHHLFITSSMKMFLPKTALIAITLIAANLFFVSSAFGQTTGDYRSNGNGAWSTLATWQRYNGTTFVAPSVGEGYPGQNAVPALVTISNNNAVTLDVSPANNLGSMVIASGNQASSLSFTSTNSLTVTGGITINSGTGPGDNKSIAVSAGSLTCASVAMTTTGNDNRVNSITVSTGTMTVSGNIAMIDTDVDRNIVRITSSGSLNVAGGVTGGNLTTVAGSTVNYNGAAQTVRAVNYNGNLTLSGTGSKDLTGVTSVGENFMLSGAATAAIAADITIGGNVTLESGTTFTAGVFILDVGGDWTNNGATVNTAGSLINFYNAAQSIGGTSSTTFENLSLSGSGTKSLNIATIITGDFSIDVGVVADLGTINTHTAGSIILDGINQSSGTWGSSSSTAINKDDTHFAATTGFVTVASATFYSIATGNWNINTTWSFSSGGPATGLGIFPIAGDVVIIEGGVVVTVTANAACSSLTLEDGGNNNTVTINPGITLDVSSIITIPRAGGGNINLVAVGAGTLNAGSIAFANGGANPRHRVTISTGTVTVTGDITTDAAGASASIIFTGAGTLNAGVGVLTTTIAGGTLTTVAGSTVNYNGAAQTVKPIAYLGNLTLSGSGDKTMTGVTAIGGNFTMGGTATSTATAGLTMGGTVTLGSGTAFTTGAFTHNVAGNWINNGATLINTGSTINLNGAAQNIGGSASTTFNNLTLAGTNTKTFGIATFADAALSINLGVVANLGAITTHTAGILVLNGANQFPGSWGSTTSAATNTNNTYFAATTGIVTVAGNFYSIANGNWNSNTTWSFSPGGPAVAPGIFPGAQNIVIIQNGFNVTVTANAACISIAYGVGNNSNTVTINPGFTLDVSGAITIPRAGGSSSNVNRMNVGAGILNPGSIAFTNGSNQLQHEIAISTGTVTVNGDITTDNIDVSASIIFSGAGTLNAAVGILTTGIAGGTLTTVAGSTVNYNGASQTVKGVNYLGNVTLSGSGAKTLLPGTNSIGGNLTLSGTAVTTTVSPLTISGNLNVGDGTSLTVGGFTFASNGTTTVGGGASGQLSVSGASTASFNNLQLATAASLTFPAADVTVSGNINFAAGGVFNPSTGRVVMNGGADQAISSNGIEFYGIQVNKAGGALNITSSLPVQHLLDIQSVTAVNSNNNLVILSRGFTTAQDAAIGPITTGASVNGGVTVQRYMDPIGNTFRYLGAPVSAALPPSNWGSTIYEYVYNAGAGSYVNHATSSALVLGTGYILGLNMSSPITWSVTGPITYGTHTWTFPEEGWHLVGNPFPSAIRWFDSGGVAWTLTNVSTTIAVTDNSISGYPNYFRYWSYNPIDNPGDWGVGELANGMVAMGQAFWVYVGTGGGSLTINESAKENALTGEFYRTKSTNVADILKITLDDGKFADVAYLKLNTNANDGYEFRYDLKKLRNPEMNVYLIDQEENQLVINTTDKLVEGKKIPIGVDVKEPGVYTLSFANLEEFTYGTRLHLIDSYEGKVVPISGGGYSFEIHDVLTSQNNRFYLSLDQVLPERKLANIIETYPNPVKDKLIIRIPSSETVTVKLMDNSGREMVSEQIKGSHEIDMSNYPQGMYVLRLISKGEVVVRKIIR